MFTLYCKETDLKATLGSVEEGLLTASEGFEAIQQLSNPNTLTFMFRTSDIVTLDHNSFGLLLVMDTPQGLFKVPGVLSIELHTIDTIKVITKAFKVATNVQNLEDYDGE